MLSLLVVHYAPTPKTSNGARALGIPLLSVSKVQKKTTNISEIFEKNTMT
jgi:hypothetical protein